VVEVDHPTIELTSDAIADILERRCVKAGLPRMSRRPFDQSWVPR
jgi:hypothetical protein